MTTKIIQAGDTVTIFWDDGRDEDAVVLNTPRGPGDLIQVQLPSGQVMAINPYHPQFKYMVRECPPQ